MKTSLLLFSLSLSLFADFSTIIPKPLQVTTQEGQFQMPARGKILSHVNFKDESLLLQKFLKQDFGYHYEIVEKGKAEIYLKLDEANSSEEAYQFIVNKNSISISASKDQGIFYGVQTLRQVIPVGTVKGEAASLTLGSVKDQPRFGWRGAMLDDSRQFWPKEYIMKHLDRMAYHKLNVFQWHLTDDDGWRIEIKKYPLLTERGAWRGPNEIIPSRYGHEGKRYGGFHTQEEIKEIVAYAKKLHIRIVPEIDVPAHAQIVMRAYPELVQDPDDKSVYKSVQGLTGNVVNPAMESTYEFLDNVFSEVAELFPGELVHVGGDERPHGSWEKSPLVKKMMQEKGFKHIDEVQAYFFQRVDKILQSKGKKMVGWEEIEQGGGLSKDTVLMSWQSTKAGIAAAKRGNYTVMAPAQFVYFDLAHNSDPEEPGYRWAGTVSTEKVYSYNPVPDGLSSANLKYILGVQTCLWGETLIHGADSADYMAFPRLCAVSEVAWTSNEQKNWSNFTKRLYGEHFRRLSKLGIKYRIPVPKNHFINGQVKIVKADKQLDVRYTTDGSEPTLNSPLYEKPFTYKGGLVKSRSFTKTGRGGRVREGFQGLKVADWNPTNITGKHQAYTLGEAKGKGLYTVEFDYVTGGQSLHVSKVQILSEGKVVANAVLQKANPKTLQNFSAAHKQLLVYKLKLENYDAAKKYSVVATYETANNKDSEGNIFLGFEPLAQ